MKFPNFSLGDNSLDSIRSTHEAGTVLGNPSGGGRFDLSVIVIAHNEEALISDCLISALEACKSARGSGLLSSFEVICVDAGSNDATNSNARKLPVTILRIPEWSPHGPGAARFVGYTFSRGNYVLFLDGDCIVSEIWLREALTFLHGSTAAAVDGNIEQAVEPDTSFAAELIVATKQSWVDRPTQVETVGQAIFRRDVLETIGPHDPFLRGGEDRELSQRARLAGYSLIRIPAISVLHYWAGKARRLSRVAYLKSVIVWSYGDGQSVRKHWKNDLIRSEQRVRYLRWRTALQYERLLLLAASILSVALALWLGSVWFFVVAGITSLAFMLLREEKGELRVGHRDSLFASCVVVVRHISLIFGLLRGTRPLDEYPLSTVNSVDR